jgi:hypothetical protein
VLVRGTVPAGTWTFTGQGGAALSIVGQNSGLVASAASPGFAIQSGSAYVRDLTFSLSASTGVDEKGGTLVLQGVKVDGSSNSGVGVSASGGMLSANKISVDSCSGGGLLLNGAAFDIENTTVTNNGPGAQGTSGGIMVTSLPTTGPAKLHLVTVQSNMGPGVSCSASIQGDGVLAVGNTPVQIASSCGVTSCATAGPTCGAQ